MSDVLSADALAVECPTCSAKVRAACYYQPQAGGPYWPRDPHPERVAAARAALLETSKRSESAWLELAEIWRGLDARGQAALSLIAGRLAAKPAQTIDQLGTITNCPLAAAAGGRVLQHGARDRGCVGPSPDQTVMDHLHHAMDHLQVAMVRPEERDDATGELHLIHAAQRAGLAAELLMSSANVPRSTVVTGATCGCGAQVWKHGRCMACASREAE
jgi:hypothetical protein